MNSVLITGASSGFGEACARKFAAQGKPLVLCARREDRLSSLAKELSEQTEVHWVALDVRDRQAVFALPAALPAGFADVGILINNAGLALGLGGADVANIDDWETMVDTNIKGVMYFTRALLPGMVARGGGHVVNVGSVAASWPYPGGNVYGGTKAFVQHIEPGMGETEFSIVRFDGDAGRAKQVYSGMQPLSGADIAEIVYWMTALPPHINVNQLEVMPTRQAWSPFAVHRDQ
jgi:3-hydroxy acid dehydrogenase / malonic semialdehyde reductase